MRERPILFSAPMVRAILDGSKTQTRRVIRTFKDTLPDGTDVDCVKDLDGLPSAVDYRPRNWELCPHGVPGDRLWVRETWHCDGEPYPFLYYRATDGERDAGWKWRPAIFMPRWASRITLEVVADVRVERVQDISEEDAQAEGVSVAQRTVATGDEKRACVTCGKHRNTHVGQVRACFGGHGTSYSNHTYRGGFQRLWDSINAKRGFGWDANPWVWAVSFRVVD